MLRPGKAKASRIDGVRALEFACDRGFDLVAGMERGEVATFRTVPEALEDREAVEERARVRRRARRERFDDIRPAVVQFEVRATPFPTREEFERFADGVRDVFRSEFGSDLANAIIPPRR